MIVMFLAAEMMLQGVSVSLVAWGRYHNDWGGQVLVIFILTVAACEAAIALALVLIALPADRPARHGRLARAARGQPAGLHRRGSARGSDDRDHAWPHLPPAGVEPPQTSRRLRTPRPCLTASNTLLILIPALPLAAALLTAVLGKRVLRQRSHVPVVTAFGRSFAAAAWSLLFACDRVRGDRAGESAASAADGDRRTVVTSGAGSSDGLRHRRTMPCREPTSATAPSDPACRAAAFSASTSRCGPTRSPRSCWPW